MNRFHESVLGLVAVLCNAVVACGGGSDGGGAPVSPSGPSTNDAGPTPTNEEGPDAATTCAVGVVRPGTVGTTSGTQTGTKVGTTWAWKGIPYAAPPVGNLRWQPPAPPTCTSGERAAASFGPMCPQLDDTGAVVGKEDCLTLNVWAPEAAQDAPVLVFLHGGANSQGSTSGALYDGAELAARSGAVVVTVEYRLGALGFFAHPQLDQQSPNKVSGNYGILDQKAALAWVKANVASFGGATTKVLLFGESAGALDTMVHIASPLSKGLFASAIVESGGAYTTTLAQGEAAMATLIAGVGCNAAPDVLKCMQGQSAEALAKVPSAAGPLDKTGFRYSPVIDGYVLTDTPPSIIAKGTHNHVALIVGSNADETSRMVPKVTTEAEYEAAVTSLYGATLGPQIIARYPVATYGTPRKALVRLTTDTTWTCPTRRLARSASQHQAEPVYRYHFSWTTPGANGAIVGATHGIELLSVFRSFTSVAGFQPSASDLALSEAVGNYWAGLARASDPNGGGRVAWPKYDAATDPYIELNTTISAEAGLSTADCDFIDSLSQ